MTLAPFLFPLIPTPHSPPPAHTLSRSSECPGGTHGHQVSLTSTLAQMLFSLPGTFFPLIPSPNDQPTPPHPSGPSREAVSLGSPSSGLSPYPVHPLYHFAPLTLLVPPLGLGHHPPWYVQGHLRPVAACIPGSQFYPRVLCRTGTHSGLPSVTDPRGSVATTAYSAGALVRAT